MTLFTKTNNHHYCDARMSPPSSSSARISSARRSASVGSRRPMPGVSTDCVVDAAAAAAGRPDGRAADGPRLVAVVVIFFLLHPFQRFTSVISASFIVDTQK